jgi:hypothetical protein
MNISHLEDVRRSKGDYHCAERKIELTIQFITICIIMNTTKTFNAEYFKNKFAKHDAIIKEIMENLIIPKTSSRKKRDYESAFLERPPYTRFTDELE